MTTESAWNSRKRRQTDHPTAHPTTPWLRATVAIGVAVLSACSAGESSTPESTADPVPPATPPAPTDPTTTAADTSTTIVGTTIVGTSPTGTAPPADTRVVEEFRREIGPRALDVDASMMMVLDSIDMSGDDLFVRLRVVNASDRFLNVEAEETRYGPLLELHADDGATYLARAVEPIGVDVFSIGQLRLRLDGPFDRDAEEFTIEINTSRGRLMTEPIPTPTGDIVRWWTEAAPVAFDDPPAATRDDRIVEVFAVVDRGTHVDVAIRAVDEGGGFDVPADATATLHLPDGTELRSLPIADTTGGSGEQFDAVLRFVGRVPAGSGSVALRVAGVEVEIPLSCDRAVCADAAIEPPHAAPSRLPDLLHQYLTTDPLPASTLTVGS